MKNARAKRAKLLFFIAKYGNLWRFCRRRRRACLNSLTTPERNAAMSDEIKSNDIQLVPFIRHSESAFSYFVHRDNLQPSYL